MKQIIYYESYDGKRFDNKIDCERYEETENLERLKNDLSIYSESGNELTTHDYTVRDILAQAKFYIVKSVEAWDFLEEIGDRYSYLTPADYNNYDSGLWYSDEQSDAFIHWNSKYEEITEIGKRFNMI